MRMDLQDGNGAAPARPSASTLAQNVSSSGQGKMMMSSAAGSNALTEHIFGEEVEVSSLLVLDQHTFEGAEIILFTCHSKGRGGSIEAAARVRCVRLRKSNHVKIIPMHMMIREIISGRQKRVRRCPL